MKVAIIGYGYVGKAYHKMFPNAVIYDEPQKLVVDSQGNNVTLVGADDKSWPEYARRFVNDCDLAIICVPTDLKDGNLDVSIVEEVVDWLETPLILIKSALQPGTVDRLVKETGKKIAVSVEMVGEGSYFIPPKYPHATNPKQHPTLIVGGEAETASACAEILWERMSPDIQIHIVTALEAEITKLVENFYGSMKVTFVNTLLSLTKKAKVNFHRVHQAWSSDPRVDSMHLRSVSFKRGWGSKCWDKDPKALSEYAKNVGADDLHKLVETILELNEEHLKLNQES